MLGASRRRYQRSIAILLKSELFTAPGGKSSRSIQNAIKSDAAEISPDSRWAELRLGCVDRRLLAHGEDAIGSEDADRAGAVRDEPIRDQRPAPRLVAALVDDDVRRARRLDGAPGAIG